MYERKNVRAHPVLRARWARWATEAEGGARVRREDAMRCRRANDPQSAYAESRIAWQRRVAHYAWVAHVASYGEYEVAPKVLRRVG